MKIQVVLGGKVYAQYSKVIENYWRFCTPLTVFDVILWMLIILLASPQSSVGGPALSSAIIKYEAKFDSRFEFVYIFYNWDAFIQLWLVSTSTNSTAGLTAYDK